jgi:3-hydroxyisobutyrate dehydrogenase
MSGQGLRIGFIGIGSMGWPMAARLVAANFDVNVCDAAPGRAALFQERIGAKATSDPCVATTDANVIVTMLPTSRQVDDVLGQIANQLRRETLVIEMSSGNPSVTRQIANGLASAGVDMIDAPVSGGVSRAESGDLAIMIGGSEEAAARAEPVLAPIGSSRRRVGEVGAGQAMKALNNLVSAGGFLIGIEALLIGKRFGLDPSVMTDVLNASSGMNNSTRNKFKQFVLSRSFDSGFGLDLMVKDLSIALEVGRETSTPTPFASLCRELSAAAASLLGPGKDHTAFAEFSERLVGDVLDAHVRNQTRS